MNTLPALTLAGVFALGFATAAQAQSPQIPSLFNTNPANPVATDGSPLPHNNAAAGERLLTGRSVFVDPVGGIVGAGVGTAGDVVGVAGHVVGTGVDAAGNVVNVVR